MHDPRTRAFLSSTLATTLLSSTIVLTACGSDQKAPATAEEVRDGEALPAAPSVPAEPASTSSPTAPTVPDAQVEGAAAAADPTPARELLTEGQIAKVSELVNQAEIDQAKLAQTRAKSAKVKQFAAMMIKHHGDALTEQARLVKQLNLTPAESATSAKLKTDGQQTLQTLKSAYAAGFDAAYAKSQVEGHQKALDLLDTELIPAARTSEVQDALRRARAVVAQHLEQARALTTQ